jgi:hypothetical protein
MRLNTSYCSHSTRSFLLPLPCTCTASCGWMLTTLLLDAAALAVTVLLVCDGAAAATLVVTSQPFALFAHSCLHTA